MLETVSGSASLIPSCVRRGKRAGIKAEPATQRPPCVSDGPVGARWHRREVNTSFKGLSSFETILGGKTVRMTAALDISRECKLQFQIQPSK